jgi:gas vesicle protein
MIREKSKKGIFISFLLGGAIGGALALLFAPKAGKSLRRDIGRKTGELIEEGKKLTSDSWNGAKDAAESTLESANDFLNTGMDKIARRTDNVKDALKSGFKAYSERRSADDQSYALKEDAKNTQNKIT